ncbi:hypothetical protein [Sulfurimonas autotrophica]|uniref:Lipoprotein n=1 Tax=Sulfurimonas autotrophica (strain ATCC BAA-671 / DSM 16294 / JCM 11897 / OK10) TaxID=563040 RepID=E0UPC0_SULAO|nr:hypothetical protein [Sulfurimonas autotrophica]ADN08584.1 hypothetical protein Saut_0535 [Sulfurimonas autotrophica DSM 16294]
MKQLITTSLTASLFILLSGCATDAPVAPSQNSDLNKITNSNGKEKPGLIQKSLDSWLKNEWTLTVNKDKKVQKKYLKKADGSLSKDTNNSTEKIDNDTEVKYVEKEDRNFTLQEYIDKASAYMKVHPSDDKDSNVQKLESMPVIGK